MQQAISSEAYCYLAVCVPIVVLGAPIGSVIGSHFHRQVLASLVYISDTVALISAYAIVPVTKILIGLSVGIIAFGFLFFGLMAYAGQRIMEGLEEQKEKLLQGQIGFREESDSTDLHHKHEMHSHRKVDIETLTMLQVSCREDEKVQKLDTLWET